MYDRIRGMREDRDISQKEIANYLQIHQTTYSDYELGNINIPIPILEKLADFYKTNMDYLVGRTDYDKPYPRGAKAGR